MYTLIDYGDIDYWQLLLLLDWGADIENYCIWKDGERSDLILAFETTPSTIDLLCSAERASMGETCVRRDAGMS